MDDFYKALMTAAVLVLIILSVFVQFLFSAGNVFGFVLAVISWVIVIYFSFGNKKTLFVIMFFCSLVLMISPWSLWSVFLPLLQPISSEPSSVVDSLESRYTGFVMLAFFLWFSFLFLCFQFVSHLLASLVKPTKKAIGLDSKLP